MWALGSYGTYEESNEHAIWGLPINNNLQRGTSPHMVMNYPGGQDAWVKIKALWRTLIISRIIINIVYYDNRDLFSSIK